MKPPRLQVDKRFPEPAELGADCGPTPLELGVSLVSPDGPETVEAQLLVPEGWQVMPDRLTVSRTEATTVTVWPAQGEVGSRLAGAVEILAAGLERTEVRIETEVVAPRWIQVTELPGLAYRVVIVVGPGGPDHASVDDLRAELDANLNELAGLQAAAAVQVMALDDTGAAIWLPSSDSGQTAIDLRQPNAAKKITEAVEAMFLVASPGGFGAYRMWAVPPDLNGIPTLNELELAFLLVRGPLEVIDYPEGGMRTGFLPIAIQPTVEGCTLEGGQEVPPILRGAGGSSALLCSRDWFDFMRPERPSYHFFDCGGLDLAAPVVVSLDGMRLDASSLVELTPGECRLSSVPSRRGGPFTLRVEGRRICEGE